MNANIKQEGRITALEKRIAEAADGFVSLTAEEYDLLLSQPLGTVDGFQPLAATPGGIKVGIGIAGNGVQLRLIFEQPIRNDTGLAAGMSKWD